MTTITTQKTTKAPKFIKKEKVKLLIDNFIPRDRIFTVLFHKVDGSLRIMNCRRDVRTASNARGVSRPSASTVNVFDLQLGDYRSFRIDRVLEIRTDGLSIKSA